MPGLIAPTLTTAGTQPARIAPEFLGARLKALPATKARLLDLLLGAAAAQHEPLWLVGGPVRDLLLHRATGDLDLAASAPLRKLLSPLQIKGATIVFHDRFATARIEWAGAGIDLARTRSEYYPRPGALPEVAPADLPDDLRRRDFTINAMAIRLGDAEPELIDPLGGLADLRAGRLRILHPGSFIDDPTRMLRAVRFLARFHFTLVQGTARLLREALRLGALSTVSRERLLAEVQLLAAEPEPTRALEWLDNLGLLKAVLPGASARGAALAAARTLYRRVALHAGEFPGEPLDRLALFLLPPLHGLKGAARAAAIAGLPLPVATKKLLTGAEALQGPLSSLLPTADAAELCARLDKLRIEELLWLAALSSSRVAARSSSWVAAKSSASMSARATPRTSGTLLLDEYIRTGRNRRPHLDGTALRALGVKPGPLMGKFLRELTARVRAGELKTRAAETRFIKASIKAAAH